MPSLYSKNSQQFMLSSFHLHYLFSYFLYLTSTFSLLPHSPCSSCFTRISYSSYSLFSFCIHALPTLAPLSYPSTIHPTLSSSYSLHKLQTAYSITGLFITIPLSCLHSTLVLNTFCSCICISTATENIRGAAHKSLM